MNSLELIKKELLKQKRLLDEKGIAITVHNTNPSPAEITTALENLSFDFSQTTATEADVKMGKTFYSQNSELKTGTHDMSLIDDQKAKLRALITGSGDVEIELPEGITRIRRWAFTSDKGSGDSINTFHCHNLTIPETVTYIGEKAFSNNRITGTLIIPITCKSVMSEAFRYTDIQEVYIYAGLASASSYVFASCTQLKKAVIGGDVTILPIYMFDSCTNLNEVWLPQNFSKLAIQVFNKCTKVKLVYFTGETTSPIDSNGLGNIKTASLFVPYLYYDIHYNNSNMLAYGNTIGAYGTFNQNDVLPTGIEGYSFVWYASIEDFDAETNPITIAPNDGLMHARVTVLPSNESNTET